MPIESPRTWLKMHSLYFLGFLAFVPDVLEYMVTSGYISPAESGVWFKIAVAVVAAARIYNRRRTSAEPARVADDV